MIEQYEPKRRTYKGLHIYAIDGLQMTLPRTQDVIDAGFTGRAVSKYRESYLPRMYLTHVYDVLSRVSKDLRLSNRPDEIRDAQEMVGGLEKNSLTLYDRLYISRRLMREHIKAGNYFLFRCRKKGVVKEVQEFYKSKKRKGSFVFEGTLIHLVKVYNPKAKEDAVFATNLSREWVKKKTIRSLYSLRWEVENSFRELTETTKVQQWHSKSVNGVLQEFFATLWLINYTRIQMNLRQKSVKNPLAKDYTKSNFKVILGWINQRMGKILNKVRGILTELIDLIELTRERRKRHSRTYPRQIRGPASPYPYNNTVWNIGT